MDKIQITIFATALAILAIRLYQKFIKKNKRQPGTDKKISSGSVFPSSPKDDDYEPYSKK
ncbi:MAG: hypothetical protein EPN88_08335 [Bacteroidetes bacterium]|nr:MAG: hypothetical protein EPN88_08335 [Bacteroidota bacterium]